jgi:two-component system sensor histidine kinase RegB
LDLLISQTKRCGDILKKISQKQIIEDKFMSAIKLEDLLEEILRSFMETSNKIIKLNSEKDINKINVKRSPEIIYGLRNFIGNAVKFSDSKVEVELVSNNDAVSINIHDDGPGFPDDIMEVLGEPYIKSKSQKISGKSGLGLGTFLGKTLLERQGAEIIFSNRKSNNGASVKITLNIKSLHPTS